MSEMEPEDIFEEEFDGEEEDEERDTMEVEQPARVFRPGIDKLEEGEELQHDSSAYRMLHSLSLDWSSLSFDIIPDLSGYNRTKFPHMCYFASGTQADIMVNNKLYVHKVSRMARTQYDDDSVDGENSDDEDDDEDCLYEYRSVKHPGTVNRIRVLPQSLLQSPKIIMATWCSDDHSVYVWDMTDHCKALDAPPVNKLSAQPQAAVLRNHPTEGYGMAWSPLTMGRLLTGDCNKYIYLTEPSGHAGAVSLTQDTTPFHGHTASVEDLQWSWTDENMFASCSVDGTVKIWDARQKRHAARTFIASDVDVNVISWSRKVPYVLASGSDDGSFSVWDLRSVRELPDGQCKMIGKYKWHTDQITSIEFDPNDDSVIAVSGADDQLTIWDLSVEPDKEEEKRAQLAMHGDENVADFPDQMLFVHQGQKEIKELHWHPQIPDMLMSTAHDSMNMFIPNLTADEDELQE